MISPLIVEPVDRAALESEIATALASPATRIFLDTSTLIWTYRLHQAARSEFMDWLSNGPPPGRAKIPRRALHELSRYRHNNGVLFPFKQRLNGLPNLLRQLDEWAHLITDDARAIAFGFADRIEYFDLLRKIRTDISRALKPVISGADQKTVEDQLIPFFNALALDGDIHSDLTDLQAEFEARAEMRIPPGFEDRKKKGLAPTSEAEASREDPAELILHGANRFGDFAIWMEILDEVTSLETKPEAVVLITHDQKPDWLYLPARIIDLAGREKANSDRTDRVTLAHPLLTKELADRTGVEKLYIITVPQLAQIASREDINATLLELARAVQAEALEQVEAPGAEVPEEPEADQGAMQPPEPVGVVGLEGAVAARGEGGPEPIAGEPEQIDDSVSNALRQLPREAFQDRLYRRDLGGDPAAITAIRDLKTLNWYTQNPAARVALSLIKSGQPSNLQVFLLGRNIYQAACGGAGTPINILENLEQELRPVADVPANLFYAGALFEAYFNSNAALRTYPKSEKIEGLFELQDTPRYRPTIVWIRARIGNQADKFLALPAVAPEVRDLDVVFDPATLKATSIQFGNIDLTEPVDEPIAASPLGTALKYDRLLTKIAQHYALPEWLISVNPVYEEPRDFSAIRLREWGPSTDLTLGASDVAG